MIAVFAADQAGGADKVIALARQQGPVPVLAAADLHRSIAFFVAAAITMMLGSIPQQDVFQRVMSARERRRGDAGSGDRRRVLHPVRLRADVPRYQRADHHAGAGRRR